MEKAFIIAVFAILILGVLSGKGENVHAALTQNQYHSSQSILASDVKEYYADEYNSPDTGYAFYSSDGQPDIRYVDPLVGYQFYLEDLHQNGPRYLK